VWTPQDNWQQRTGWQRVPLVVRGRAVHLLAEVLGLCRRVGWGERVLFVIVVRGHHKRTKRGQIARADGVLGSGGVGWGGWLAVACVVGGVVVEVVAALGGGVLLDEERFWVGEEPCWGFESGERRVSWSAWVYGALVWSGYRGWGGWKRGARWAGVGGACANARYNPAV